MTTEGFDSVLSRAAALMNDPKFNMMVESKSNAYNGKPQSTPKNNIQELHEEINQIKSGNVLNNIRDSFAQTSHIDYVPQQSITTQPIQQQFQPNSPTIDYNALKFIINECIKESFQQLLSTLNEGQIKTIAVNGDKIQFLDKDGNLYEGAVSFKKNVKKKNK